MRTWMLFPVLALFILSSGCAELKAQLWTQLDKSVKKEAHAKFDEADIDENGELSKPEVDILIDKALLPIKEWLLEDSK